MSSTICIEKTSGARSVPSVDELHSPSAETDIFLRAMLVADQAGLSRSLRGLIQRQGPGIRANGLSQEVHLLEALEERSNRATELEREFGQGALLNLSHRLVSDLVARGQILSQDEIAAAMLMRADHPYIVSDWERLAVRSSADSNGPATVSPFSSQIK